MMAETKIKEIRRIFRHKRVRKQVFGTSVRLRLCVHRSLNHLFAQIVDDEKRKVLLGLSTLNKDLRKKIKTGGNITAAIALGDALAKIAKEKGVSKVCFDRGGYLYHGRIKAFAEAVRKGGLEF